MRVEKCNIVLSLDIKDCERILSWYRSEQEMLLLGQVNKEWKKEQTADTIYEKMQSNWHLVYQISKVPRHGMQSMIRRTDVIDDLIKIYGK